MARPLKEGLDYFPHDTDAVNDEKIEPIRALYGNDGYAFYFILLERIYRTPTGELDLFNIAKKAAIVKKIGVENSKFDEMLEVAFDLGLFDREHYNNTKHLTSPGIKKRYVEVDKLREKWRKKKGVFSGENPVDNKGENPTENGGK